MKTKFGILLLLFGFSVYGQVDLITKKTKSFLKIPYNHFDYNDIENQIADTVHTAIKPWHYFETDSEIINKQYQNLLLNKKTWLGKKLFDENMFVIQGDDYWITIDPVVDLRLGKDNLSVYKYLFQNTRAIRVEGSLGKQFSFSSTIAENWARFPAYLSRYATSTRPWTVPGYGLNKSEVTKFVDYPYASGYFAYKPSKFFFFELGHDTHFIGEGYHSLLLSDNAGVSPYFKIEARFWKVKYTTFWSSYIDPRGEARVGGVYRKKFSAVHYISWNALPKLNLGFFETVIWYNENRRGFDVNFLNPLVFFKTVEYETGSNGSNTIVGLNGRYKLPYKIDVYGQFVLDEMTVSKFFGEKGYWANKFGYQIGVKYHDAFSVPHLFLRLEYNTVRPYTFGHNITTVNYTHYYQSLAHPWGANFSEKILEIQYRRKRLYAHNTLIAGKKGFDFPDDSLHYGGNINNYIHRGIDSIDDNYTLQGNLGSIFQNQLEVGYILNPATRLKVFGGFILRKTEIEQETRRVKNETGKYIYFGVKTHLWKDHFDVF